MYHREGDTLPREHINVRPESESMPSREHREALFCALIGLLLKEGIDSARMEKQDIERNLSLLGEQLEELDMAPPIRLLLIGGGFMITQIGNRGTTEDVDVYVDIDDPLHSEQYHLFRSAIDAVTTEAKLPEMWLSDTTGDFMRLVGPIPKGKRWRQFGRSLVVYIPPLSYVLALKLVAGREKDQKDIRALFQRLRITKREQAQKILDKYITNREIQEIERVQEKLDDLFS